MRHEKSKPLLIDLEIWMRQQRALLSSSNDTAKAINYLFNRWAAFTRFVDDGRVYLSNNAADLQTFFGALSVDATLNIEQRIDAPDRLQLNRRDRSRGLVASGRRLAAKVDRLL